MKKTLTLILVLTSVITLAQNSAIENLWRLYNSGDFKSVIKKATPLLENDANNSDVNLLLGRSHAELGDYTNAIPHLKRTIKNDHSNSWRKAWALGYLGTCYFGLQKYDDAERSLNECVRLNATKNATNYAYGKSILFGYHEFYKNWKVIETNNFRFHFQNMNDADIEKFTISREAAYKKINEFFKSTLPKKTDMYVWGSRDDAKKILRTNIGFSNPDLCIIHTHYQQTLGHEITHVISNYTTAISTKTRFINEGTAVCFDLSQQDRLKQIKDWIAANDKQVTIGEFWENGDQYAEEILYPVAGLFVKDLIDSFGRGKFIEFFANQTYENAKLVFGDKLDKVIKEFEEKIK